MDFTAAHGDQQSPGIFPWYALRELAAPVRQFEVILEEAMALGLVTDATVAQSEGQRQAPWASKRMPEFAVPEGARSHDVWCPFQESTIDRQAPGCGKTFAAAHGHVLRGHGRRQPHFNVSQPFGMTKKYLDLWNK
jgi:hypothetical protein